MGNKINWCGRILNAFDGNVKNRPYYLLDNAFYGGKEVIAPNSTEMDRVAMSVDRIMKRVPFFGDQFDDKYSPLLGYQVYKEGEISYSYAEDPELYNKIIIPMGVIGRADCNNFFLHITPECEDLCSFFRYSLDKTPVHWTRPISSAAVSQTFEEFFVRALKMPYVDLRRKVYKDKIRRLKEDHQAYQDIDYMGYDETVKESTKQDMKYDEEHFNDRLNYYYNALLTLENMASMNLKDYYEAAPEPKPKRKKR